MASVLFSWALCLLLLATFVWTDWLAGWFVFAMWGCLFAFWVTAVVRTQLKMVELLEDFDESATDLFANAQVDYLRGNWFDAEATLLSIVQKKPSDVAANLLLVGVLRRTQRWQAAKKKLEQVSLYDSAAGWFFEIQREKALILDEMPAEETAHSDDAKNDDIATADETKSEDDLQTIATPENPVAAEPADEIFGDSSEVGVEPRSSVTE